MHDFVIRNAEICDGTGARTFAGAIAVSGGKIREIGNSVGPGQREIDANGSVVAPGIIDNHTHYDAQITWDAFVSPSLELGVTTVLMGNCGFTIAPCRPGDRELILKNLTQVEGMSLDALLAGTKKDYESFADYMALLETNGVVPNVAVYCGHSSVRNWVMGPAATEREATPEELVAMCEIIREALRVGAIGFATSTFEGHNGWGGTPMPSRFAAKSELEALVGVLGEEGRGIFMLTKGRSTPIDYLETIAAATDRPIAVAAIQYDHANPDRAFNDMRAIGAAVERGRRMVGQVACTAISMDFTLRGAYLFEALEAWRPAIALYEDSARLTKFYSDPEFREAMKSELLDPKALNRFTDQWDKLEVVKVVKEENSKLEGRMVGDIAQEADQHPLDWLLDFGAKENFDTLFNAQILNADEDQVLQLLKDPNATIGLADAGAHLHLFCDADFGLHMLGHWTRERGDFTLPEAVAALTSVQADVYGIRDRGRLAIGNYADLIMFDKSRVGRGNKKRVFDLPTGASRLVREGSGVLGVWVNGVQVVDNGGVMPGDHRPGHVLRKFAT